MILMLVLITGSVCCVAEVTPAAKVAWTGETFLDVTYKQVNGRQIKMYIYMPPDSRSAAAPVLYYVHGRGWAAGSKAKGGLPLMQPVLRLVAEKGFVCVSINYGFCQECWS